MPDKNNDPILKALNQMKQTLEEIIRLTPICSDCGLPISQCECEGHYDIIGPGSHTE